MIVQPLDLPWEALPAALQIEGDGAPVAAQILEQAAARGALALHARCSAEADGPFAGVSTLLHALVDQAERAGLTDVVVAHDGALALLAPSLAVRYPVRFPILTLTVPDLDAVRTLPADFITRAIHGTIDFLFALQIRLGDPPLCLGLIDWEEGGPLAREFLTILARRAADRPLLLWTASARAEAPELSLPTTVRQAPPTQVRPSLAPAHPTEARFGSDIWAALATGDRAGALALIGEASTYLLRRGQTHDALRYAEWAWDLMPGQVFGLERWPYLKMLMRAALAVGDFPRVEALVTEAQQLPLRPRAKANCLYILAMLHARYFQERDVARALTLMGGCMAELERDPEPEVGARAFYQNAYALVVMRQGRLEEAYVLCRGALEDLLANSTPDQYRLHKAILPHNLGRVKAAAGDHAAAINHFTEALGQDPYYSDLYLERGLSRLRLGQAAAAFADFDRGLACGLPSPHLSVGYGNACIALGRPADGVAAFTRALILDDQVVQAYKDRALCLYDLGRHQEALSDYNRYLAARPADAEALVNRASLRDDLGDQVGARDDLDEALRLQPTNVAALTNRAVLLANQGTWAEALASMEQALALDPENELLGQNLALLVEAAAAAKEAG